MTTGHDHPPASLDEFAKTSQDAQFDDLVTRLTDRYGSQRAPEVRQIVGEERNRFTDAKAEAFVPILVERSVRARLAS